MGPNILIIAGEPSGDIRGAELVRELKPLLNDVSFWGFGGDAMSAEGVEIVRHIRDLSMVGAVEIIHKLPDVWRHYLQIKRLCRERKPRMAILIDYPGFNLRVAGLLSSLSVPVVYFIIPQVWAWGRGRLKKIKKYVRKALVLFPFEKTLLQDNGIDCEFVGHPIVDAFQDSPAEDRAETGLAGSGETLNIALLPGSRKHEINYMLPVMLEAAAMVRGEIPQTRFFLAESPNIDKSVYDSFLSSFENLVERRWRGDTAGTLANCDMAIITSGTATLEGAMMVKPMVIVYKASPITYLFYLLLSRTPFLGLVNIVAGKEIAPELLQHDLTARNLARTVLEISEDPERLNEMRTELRKVKDALGESGAAGKAAGAVSSLYETLYGQG